MKPCNMRGTRIGLLVSIMLVLLTLLPNNLTRVQAKRIQPSPGCEESGMTQTIEVSGPDGSLGVDLYLNECDTISLFYVTGATTTSLLFCRRGFDALKNFLKQDRFYIPKFACDALTGYLSWRLFRINVSDTRGGKCGVIIRLNGILKPAAYYRNVLAQLVWINGNIRAQPCNNDQSRGPNDSGTIYAFDSLPPPINLYASQELADQSNESTTLADASDSSDVFSNLALDDDSSASTTSDLALANDSLDTNSSG